MARRWDGANLGASPSVELLGPSGYRGKMPDGLDPEQVAVLVRFRLLARPPKGLSVADLKAQLYPYVRALQSEVGWGSQVEAQLDALAQAGQVKGMALTDEGHRLALAPWGEFGSRPARWDWRRLKRIWLPAWGLGLVPTEPVRRRLADPDGFRALVLARAHDLDAQAAPTLKQVLDRLAWRALGIEGETGPFLVRRVHALVLAREPSSFPTEAKASWALRKVEPPPEGGQWRSWVGRRVAQWCEVRGVGVDVARVGAVRRRLKPSGSAPVASASSPGPASAGAPDPHSEGFVQTVRQVALKPEVARFSPRKVFIASIWDHWPGGPPRSLDDFKTALVDAHRKGVLRLLRADLVEAMDPDLVLRSRTPYLNATFHFVELDP